MLPKSQNLLPSYIITLTRTSPTKMGYIITFYKISRRKEGGGARENKKNSKNIFQKNTFGIFLGPKKSDQFRVGIPHKYYNYPPGMGEPPRTWLHLRVNNQLILSPPDATLTNVTPCL